MNTKIRLKNYVLSPNCGSDFLTQLASYLDRKESMVLQQFTNSLSYHQFDQMRSIKDITLHTPKICMQCLLDREYFLDEWQIIYITHCNLHNSLLHDACPNCHHTFKWDAKLFTQCPKCHLQWKDICTVPNEVPVYQKVFTNTNQEQLKNDLKCLSTSMIFALRPKDLMFNELQTLELSNAKIHSLLLNAHRLLADRTYRITWLNRYNSSICAPSFEGQALSEQLEILASKYSHQTCDQNYLFEIKSDEEFISVRKPRLKAANITSELQYQVGLNEAGYMLNLATLEITALWRTGYLHSIIETRSPHSLLFDTRSLKELIIDALTKRAVNAQDTKAQNDISLFKAFKKLKYFNLTIAQFIKLLIENKKITIYETEDGTSSLWERLFVDRKELFSLLNQNIQKNMDGGIHLETLSKMLCVTKTQLKELLKHTYLGRSHNNHARYVSSKIVSSYLSNFMMLKREAKLFDYTEKQILEKLNLNCINPCYTLTSDYEPKPLYIFSRTDELKQVLSDYNNA